MRLRGWPLTAMVLAVTAVWGLKVAWLCGTAVREPRPDQLQSASDSADLILRRMPVNVIERFCDELGLRTVRPDPTGVVPWPEMDTLFVLGARKAEPEFWQMAIPRVARSGLRLVLVLPQGDRPPDLSALGLAFGHAVAGELTLRPAIGLPLLAEVTEVRVKGAYPLESRATPGCPLLEGARGGTFGVLLPAGRGEVVVLPTPRIGELDEIDKADNGLLLASLALRRRPSRAAALPPAGLGRGRTPLEGMKPVGFIHLDATAREELITTLTKLQQSWALEVRDRPLLTLWSILRANPETLVLFQVLLLVAVHLLGSGRRLEQDPGGAGPPPADAFLRGFEGLCTRVPCERLLLPGCAQDFRWRLARRLGLAPGAGLDALHARLTQAAPALAGSFSKLADDLEKASTEAAAPDREYFVRLLREMDRILEGVTR